ncbi:MAG: hypothetical protein C0474_12565 [Sphingobium sp.]|nr:hypothetical protein [Sphingobium sp.]
MNPFTWAKGRVGCLTGTHFRSAKRAVHNPNTDKYESICSYCGVPMVRLAKRNWVAKSKL